MQKLIAVPMVRYKNLVDKENSKTGLKKTVDAMMRLQENQELLQRQKHYDLIDEEMPKNHNKIIPQTAVTALPPPPIHKIREYKKRKQMLTDAELDAFFGTKSRKNKKNTVPKPVTKKQTKPKPTSPVKIQKSKFNLFDRAAFHKKSKNDKALCYYYKFYKSSKIYLCRSCFKKNLYVSAKIETNQNGQKYVIQGKNKHACDAIKYEPEKEIEKFTNFIFHVKTEKSIAKLIVFTSDARTHCYVYRKEHSKLKQYLCTRCTPTKYVWAKTCEDENGQNYLEFSEHQHICTPLEYNPAKFIERQYLSPDEFELFPNTKGAPDARVIILDVDDCNFGYEYKFTDRFNCNQCILKAKKRISAKLIKNENGEKCFELSNSEHHCEKLNFKEIGRIIYSSDYKFDDVNQTITTSHPKDPKLCYKFAYDNTHQMFYCVGCQKKKKFVAAKICNKSDNKEFLLVAFDHLCVPLTV